MRTDGVIAAAFCFFTVKAIVKIRDRGGQEVRKKEKFEDDGRQIANMNIEGMPWYDKDRSLREKMQGDIPQNLSSEKKKSPLDEMTRKERWLLYRSVMAACLLIGFIFAGAAVLFILFCVYVWL